MPDYEKSHTLRHIDPVLWKQVRTKCIAMDTPIYKVVYKLLEDWVKQPF